MQVVLPIHNVCFLISFFISAFTFMGGVLSYNDTTFGLLSMVAENWFSICLGFIFFSFLKETCFFMTHLHY
jgi:hypothetical protein